MRVKPFLILSGVVFAAVAGMHVWRAVAALPVLVGATAVPVGVSWLAAGVAGALCVWAFRLVGRS